MSTKILTDVELQSLLPTITIGNEKPKEQQWFQRSEVLKIMRAVEDATQKLNENSFVSLISLG